MSNEHDRTRDAVVVNGVSSEQEPSVRWGWHAHYPKLVRALGLVVAACLLVMLHGSNDGEEAHVWLAVLAAGLIALSIGSMVRTRSGGRRRPHD